MTMRASHATMRATSMDAPNARDTKLFRVRAFASSPARSTLARLAVRARVTRVHNHVAPIRAGARIFIIFHLHTDQPYLHTGSYTV